MHIIGASGHSKVIIDILELCNHKVDGIWDDNEEISSFLNYNILGNLDSLQAVSNPEVIIAIGNNYIRMNIASTLNVNYCKAIHPSSQISKSASIDEGTVVMANVAVNAEAVIGRHVILNTGCIIDHECIIEDYVHISPKVALAGNVFVGEGTHVGIGANIIQGVNIGKWATIGAGATIIRDVPDYAVVVGTPGKIISMNAHLV